MGSCQSQEPVEQRPLAISIDTRQLLRNELPISPFANRNMSIHTSDLQPLTFQIRINRIKVRNLQYKNGNMNLRIKWPGRKDYETEEVIAASTYTWKDDFTFTYVAEEGLKTLSQESIEIEYLNHSKVIGTAKISLFHISDGPFTVVLEFISNAVRNKQGQMEAKVVGNVTFVCVMEQIDKWEMIVKSASALLSSNVNVNTSISNTESRSYFLVFISRTEKEEDDILYHSNPHHLPVIDSDPQLPSAQNSKSRIEWNENELKPISITTTFREWRDIVIKIQLRYFTNDKDRNERDSIYHGEAYLTIDKAINCCRKSSESTSIINIPLHYNDCNCGTISIKVKINNIPKVSQNLSGVLLKDGISIKSPVIVPPSTKAGKTRKKEKKEVMPSRIDKLNELVTIFQNNLLSSKAVSVKQQLNTLEDIKTLLKETEKDSIITYIYPSKSILLEAQYQFLKIYKILFDVVDELDYPLKCSVLDILILIDSRGELSDLTLLGFDIVNPDVNPSDEDLAFCLAKRDLDVKTLLYVTQKVCQLGISTRLLKSCSHIIAMSMYRLPFWGEYIFKAVKKYKENLPDWMKLETARFVDSLKSANSVEEHDEVDQLIETINWKLVDKKLTMKYPTDIENQNKLINEDNNPCINQISKYGRLYFSVYNEWLNCTFDMLKNMYSDIQWSRIVGYKTFLKSFFVQLRLRDISTFPDSMLAVSKSLLVNRTLLSLFINAIMSKTQMYDVCEIGACLDLCSDWFNTHLDWSLKTDKCRHPNYNQLTLLPATFDFHFICSVMNRLLSSEHNQILLKTFEFLYTQWDTFSEMQCDILRSLLIKKKRMYRFFLHWCEIVRKYYDLLLLYRILRPRRWWEKQRMTESICDEDDEIIDFTEIVNDLYYAFEGRSHKDLSPNGFHVIVSGSDVMDYILNIKVITTSESIALLICNELCKSKFIHNINGSSNNNINNNNNNNNNTVEEEAAAERERERQEEEENKVIDNELFINSPNEFYYITLPYILCPNYYNITKGTYIRSVMDPLIIPYIEASLRQIRRKISITPEEISGIELEIEHYEKNKGEPTKAASGKYLAYHNYLHKTDDLIKSLNKTKVELNGEEENDRLLLGKEGEIPENLVVYTVPALTQFETLIQEQHDLINSTKGESNINCPTVHWVTVVPNLNSND